MQQPKALSKKMTQMAARLGGISIAYAMTMIVVAVVNIVLYIHTAMWIYNMNRSNKCQCADDWRKRYVLYFPLASIVVGIFILPFVPAFSAPVSLLLMVGWIVFIISALQYVKKLRVSKCTCATSGYGDEGLNVYAYVPIISWSISIIFILAVLIVISTLRK